MAASTSIQDDPERAAALSDYEQDVQLKNWIRNSNDPMPTEEDVERKGKEWFGADFSVLRRYTISDAIQTRTFDGPPVSHISLPHSQNGSEILRVMQILTKSRSQRVA